MIQDSDDDFGGSFLIGGDSSNDLLSGDDVEDSSDISGDSSNSESAADENNNVTDPNGVTYTYYHTDYLTPGSILLDYQGKLISDGFITQTSFYEEANKDPLKAYDNYVTWRDGMKAEYTAKMPMSISYDSWRKRDGSYVDMTNADMSGAPTVISSYMAALNQYLSLKSQYYTYMETILDIEHKVYMLGQNTSVFSGTDELKSIWVY